MTTVLLTGVGALGSWSLEFLARSDGIDRIVTVKRSPWGGPSRVNLAMIGAVFQGHAKAWEHHQIDLADTAATARLLAQVRPDAVLHSATVQSPRRLMNADLDPGVRRTLRAATFGMWLPWHFLPARHLVAAVESSGIDTLVVNASFPDVVNPLLWRHFGHGPVAGAGNVEVCAAQVLRYLVDIGAGTLDELDVSLVGSHALLAYGPEVPHHLQIVAGARDLTADHDLAEMLAWPERIAWSGVDDFSLFAASAVKNLLALVGDVPIRTHVSGPNGLPGGYPAFAGSGMVDLDLPSGLSRDDAVALNEAAARWDGIDSIAADGTVTYTETAHAAMAELGLEEPSFGPAEAADRAARLSSLYQRLTTLEGTNA